MDDTASERDLEFEADTSDQDRDMQDSFANRDRPRADSYMSESDRSEDGGGNYRQERIWSTYSGDGATMHQR